MTIALSHPAGRKAIGIGLTEGMNEVRSGGAGNDFLAAVHRSYPDLAETWDINDALQDIYESVIWTKTQRGPLQQAKKLSLKRRRIDGQGMYGLNLIPGMANVNAMLEHVHHNRHRVRGKGFFWMIPPALAAIAAAGATGVAVGGAKELGKFAGRGLARAAVPAIHKAVTGHKLEGYGAYRRVRKRKRCCY